MVKFIGSILAFAMLAIATPTAQASTVRWTSVDVAPTEVNLRCKYRDRIVDVQTRDSIAVRYGLVGAVEAVSRKISAMRGAGYRVSGARGRERVSIELPYSGVFEQPIKFSVRATMTELHLYGRFPQGHGRLLTNNRAKQYLTDENRRRMEQTYRVWEEGFNDAMRRLSQKYGDYVFALKHSERPDLSHAMGGTVKKGIRNFGACDTRYDLAVKGNWRRIVDGGLGQ